MKVAIEVYYFGMFNKSKYKATKTLKEKRLKIKAINSNL